MIREQLDAPQVIGTPSPFFDLARELDARGYGNRLLQVYTPTGTPSLRGKVSTLATLAITESDKGGLRFRKFTSFPPRGASKESEEGSEGV